MINTINNIKAGRICTAVLLLICCSINLLRAQDDLPTGEVEVVKDFDARIADTKRLGLSPKIPEATTSEKSFLYTVSSKQLEVSYEPPVIKPLSMPTDKNPESYRGFLKAGAGYPTSIYGELGYQTALGSGGSKSRGRGRGTKSRSRGSRGASTPSGSEIGIHLLHHQIDNTSRIADQKWRESEGNLMWKTSTNAGFTLRADAGYRIEDRYFYGVLDSSDVALDPEDIRRRYNTLTAGLGIRNSHENSLGIDYHARIDYSNHGDDLRGAENSENSLELRLGASKYIADKQKLGVELLTDYDRYIQACEVCEMPAQELTNFLIKPYLDLYFGTVRADLGATLTSTGGSFDFFPDVELSAQVAGSQVIAYVGADGGLRKNTFLSLSSYNPWVAPGLDSIFNSTERNYYGGVKGQIKSVSYEGKVSYTQVTDMPLYLNNVTERRYFDVLTDEVNILRVGGTVSARITDNFEASLSLAQNIYSLEVQEEPWHLPSFEANAGIRFMTPNDKLIVKGNLYLEDAIPFLDENGEAAVTSTLFDINVGAEYLVTKNVGLFLELNNLADSQRQRWAQYPQMGLNVLGGVTARF